ETYRRPRVGGAQRLWIKALGPRLRGDDVVQVRGTSRQRWPAAPSRSIALIAGSETAARDNGAWVCRGRPDGRAIRGRRRRRRRRIDRAPGGTARRAHGG